MVTPTWTYLAGDVIAPTPADALSHGLAPLLDRVSATFAGSDGVLIIDARAAQALGLPARAAELPDDGAPGHPALEAARAVGWDTMRLRPWTDFWAEHRAGQPRVHLCILPLVDFSAHPIMCTNPLDTISALTIWHEAMGSGYCGTPGASGISALRDLAAAGKDRQPLFQPRETGPDAEELAYLESHFVGRKMPRGTKFFIGWDARMMYLAAQAIVQVAAFGLKRTGKMSERDPKAAGWFLVDLCEWKDEPRLPDPAGYGPQGSRWVTGPTLALIDELVTASRHGGYEILDSWTAPILSAGSGRVLKPWADRIRDGLYSDAVGPDHDAARAALKACYRESNGMLKNPNSRIRRPDWHSAVVAQARTNLWRKMDAIGGRLKIFPLQINTDMVWYPAKTDDPEKECPTWVNETTGKPEGIIMGNRLGNFWPKQIRPIAAGGSK